MLLLATPLIFSQSSTNFTGTWKLDPASYKAPPHWQLLKDGKFSEESLRVEIAADGKPHTSGPVDTVSVKVIDDKTVKFVDVRDGKPAFDETDTVSDDSQTLTEQLTIFHASGQSSNVTRTSKRLGQFSGE